MATVQLENITKHYGTEKRPGPMILKGIDLTLKKGEFVVVVGPSGCGKSTLLRIIAGLERPTTGSITIAEEDVTDREPAERNIAMVFQNYALYPHMTVRQNMSYGAKLAKMPKAEIESRIQSTAKMLEIEALLDKKPNQLSGGQRQRVAMGRAIMRKPKLFLFDEPLSNLDAKLRTTTRLEIRRRHEAIQTTSLYVTHDQTEAMTLADRIIVMNGGVVEQFGTPEEIFHSPQTTFVASFMGSPAMNLITLDYREDEFWCGDIELTGLAALWHGGKPDAVKEFESIMAHYQYQVILGVRPEHFRLEPQPAADALVDSFSPTWKVTLTMAETLGSEQLLYSDFGGTGITIRTSGRRLAELIPKTEFLVSFDKRNIHWFSAENGQRITELHAVSAE